MSAIVLFDLDGTLTDPRIGIVGSYRHALAAAGSPAADDADLTWVIGPPIRENLGLLGVAPERMDVAVQAYRERHWAGGLYEVELIPGMADLVRDLAGSGVVLALATAKPEDQGVATLEHLGLAEHFAVMAGAPGGEATTKAMVIARALALLAEAGHQVEQGRAVMVGDRRHDVEGAHEHGLFAVGVGWGFARDGELAAAGVDRMAADAAELRAVLGEVLGLDAG